MKKKEVVGMMILVWKRLGIEMGLRWFISR